MTRGRVAGLVVLLWLGGCSPEIPVAIPAPSPSPPPANPPSSPSPTPTASVEAPAPEGADGVFVVQGLDLEYIDAPETLPAGGAVVELRLESAGVPHTVVFEGIDGEARREGDALVLSVDGQPGSDRATVHLPTGEHTYYCEIPGHRSAGMEGTLTAS